MLVAPRGYISVLLEVASGTTFSPASILVDGALRNGVPVLFDASFLRAWVNAAEAISEGKEKREKDAARLIKSLKERGMAFIGFENENGLGGGEAVPVTLSVTLRGGGWLSWGEIAPLVSGAGTVLLAGGTKLTPEAADRLLKLNIRVEEVF
jgi:hypothetical protein